MNQSVTASYGAVSTVVKEVTMDSSAAACATGNAGALLLLAVAVVVTVSSLAILTAIRSRRHFPPGAPSPPRLPLLGHLHLLDYPLHRSLASIAITHGRRPGASAAAPVLSLRLGTRRALLVSTHAAAVECFTECDVALAGRPRLLAGDVLGYGCTYILWASYGDHWRTLRRFFTTEILSASRLAARATDRHAEVVTLVDTLFHDAADSARSMTIMTLRPRLFEFVINVMLRALIGASLHGSDAGRWQQTLEESVRLNAVTSVGDLYPALRWVDRLRGVDATLARLQARRDSLVVGLIEDHRRKRDAGGVQDTSSGNKVALDDLLSLQEADPSYYTDTVIKGIVMATLQGGAGTSMLTIEWAMAQLLLHPEAMNKVRMEIDTHVGTARLVEESDIPNLAYLQCVVKETLRLRPVGPIIPAHEAMEDCIVAGFHVEQGTTILVNAWAIQRDPALWDAPDEFMPERFLDDAGKMTSAAVPMLPFGMGRRRCPAEAMAIRLVSSTVAALVQCFEWDVGNGRTIDMTEGAGLSMAMATPLAAVCRPREFVKSMLSAATRK